MTTLTEEQVERVLVGSPVVISVGEPWDFESPDGQNTLRGTVAAAWQEGSDHPSQRVRLEVTPFAAGEGVTVTHLTAQGRYVEETGIIEHLAKGERADVNLGYADQVGEEDLPDGKSPFLIGSVRLRD